MAQASPLDGIDFKLHHLFMPQIEALGMEPKSLRCGIVSQMDPERGHGCAWMSGIGADCLITVLDLSVKDVVDLSSHSSAYCCIGSMSKASIETMPAHTHILNESGLVMFGQDEGEYPYRLRPNSPYISRSICFTPRFLKELAKRHGKDPEALFAKLYEVSRNITSPRLKCMFDALNVSQADSATTGYRLSSLMLEAVACLVETSQAELEATDSASSKASRALVEDVRNLMTRNLDRPLTLDGIAKELCVSRSNLAATYKCETGHGVAEDFKNMRMEHAMKLIREGNLPLAEVARRVGYPRQSSFSEAFKGHFGKTPSSFKRG